MIVQLREPSDRNLLRSDRRVGAAGLGVAVPVAAPGPKQSQTKREVGQTGTHVRIVTGVARLYSIQPLPLEALEHLHRSALLEMGRREQSAHRVNHLCDLGE